MIIVFSKEAFKKIPLNNQITNLFYRPGVIQKIRSKFKIEEIQKVQ